MKISSLDRRKFLRGSGVALALPWSGQALHPCARAHLTDRRGQPTDRPPTN